MTIFATWGQRAQQVRHRLLAQLFARMTGLTRGLAVLTLVCGTAAEAQAPQAGTGPSSPAASPKAASVAKEATAGCPNKQLQYYKPRPDEKSTYYGDCQGEGDGVIVASTDGIRDRVFCVSGGGGVSGFFNNEDKFKRCKALLAKLPGYCEIADNYAGQCKDGKPNGIGLSLTTTLEPSTSPRSSAVKNVPASQERYLGSFRDGLPHGYGQIGQAKGCRHFLGTGYTQCRHFDIKRGTFSAGQLAMECASGAECEARRKAPLLAERSTAMSSFNCEQVKQLDQKIGSDPQHAACVKGKAAKAETDRVTPLIAQRTKSLAALECEQVKALDDKIASPKDREFANCTRERERAPFREKREAALKTFACDEVKALDERIADGASKHRACIDAQKSDWRDQRKKALAAHRCDEVKQLDGQIGDAAQHGECLLDIERPRLRQERTAVLQKLDCEQVGRLDKQINDGSAELANCSQSRTKRWTEERDAAVKGLACDKVKELDEKLKSGPRHSDCQFQVTLSSKDPQEMYLAAGKFAEGGDQNRAKELFRAVRDRFPKDPLAIRATDALVAIANREAIEASNSSRSASEVQAQKEAQREGQRALEQAGRDADFRQRQAQDSQRQQQKQICLDQKYACERGCEGLSWKGDARINCKRGCPSCSF